MTIKKIIYNPKPYKRANMITVSLTYQAISNNLFKDSKKFGNSSQNIVHFLYLLHLRKPNIAGLNKTLSKFWIPTPYVNTIN